MGEQSWLVYSFKYIMGTSVPSVCSLRITWSIEQFRHIHMYHMSIYTYEMNCFYLAIAEGVLMCSWWSGDRLPITSPVLLSWIEGSLMSPMSGAIHVIRLSAYAQKI